MMRHIRQASGLFLALLAIVAQLTVAVAMPTSIVSLADAMVLCQHDGATDVPAVPSHQSPDCLVCFFCHHAAGPAGLVVSSSIPPVRGTIQVARVVVLPPATAPPLRVIRAASPRGPPILV